MYTIAILIFSALALIEVFNKEITEKYKLAFALICYSFLIFHDGFRWETGTDWEAYQYIFNSITTIGYEDESIEPGFMLLISSIKMIFDDYSVYLIIHAIIFYSAFFYVIFKLADFPFTTLLVFYMLIVPYLGMNRQFLAMAIYGIALVEFVEGRRWSFIILILIALLFHRTAILALPILILQWNIPKKYIIIGLSICLLISISGILNSISMALSLFMGNEDSTGKKLDIYVNVIDNQFSLISTLLSLVKKLLWLSLIIIFEPLIDNKDKKYYILRNIYAFSIMIYILFNGTALQIVVSRGLLYYNLAEMFMIPYVLTIFKQNYGKLIVMFVLMAYCVVNIYKGFSNYGEGTDYFIPYKGLYINTDYVRQNTD